MGGAGGSALTPALSLLAEGEGASTAALASCPLSLAEGEGWGEGP
jgi:hypothetical protein